MKAESAHSTITGCFKDMVKREGVLSLYRGFTSSLLLTLNPVLQFSLYESFKRGLGDSLSYSTYFILAAFTKFIATIFTFPLSTVRTRQQLSESTRDFTETLKELTQHGGPLALFRGFSTKLLQTLLNSGIILATHERFTRFYSAKLLPRKLHTLSAI